MNENPIFRTVIFCATISLLVFAISAGQWFFTGLLIGLAVLDISVIVKGVRRYRGRFRVLQIASCANTIVSAWCIWMASLAFSGGNPWGGWLNVGLVLLNVAVVYGQRKTFRQGLEVERKIEEWLAEYFTKEDLVLLDKNYYKKVDRYGKSDS
jgi:hypothetical protein